MKVQNKKASSAPTLKASNFKVITNEVIPMLNTTVTTAKIQSVSFHNQLITALDFDSKPFIAMRPICENIGLDWEAQRQRIKRNHILNKGACMIKAPTNSGMQEFLCLPLGYLNGWLFGIDINRVKPEIKDKLIQYQEECFEVLFNHFMPQARTGLSPEHQRHIQNVVSRLANVAGNSFQSVYRSIKDRFQVGTYKDIPEDKYPALCEFLQCKPLEGEYISFEKEDTVTLSLEELYRLAWLCNASMYMRERIEVVTPALDVLGSSYHGIFFSMGKEYKHTINRAKKVIINKLEQIGFPVCFDGKHFPDLTKY